METAEQPAKRPGDRGPLGRVEAAGEGGVAPAGQLSDDQERPRPGRVVGEEVADGDQPGHGQVVAGEDLVGPIVSGLGYSEHFLTRGGRRPPALDAPLAQQLEYWTSTDPWIVAAGNDTARQRLRALLAANPHNLRPAAGLERRPESSALARLGQVSVPTLVLVGEADIPDVHAHCGAIEAGIGGASRVVLPGSGHLPHLEVPDAFNRVVLEFLHSHTDRG